MRKHWWKALGVLLVFISLTVGLLVPLKPGIPSITPTNGKTGELISIRINGYNTHFKDASENKAWLKLDEKHALSAQTTQATTNTYLTATFQMPAYLPSTKKVVDFSLIIDNEKDGAFVLPNAIFITQNTINEAAGSSTWTNSSISNLHDYSGFAFPYRNILQETIRNLYYHVSLWFSMFILLVGSIIYSFKYLRHFQLEDDLRSKSLTAIAVIFGLMGCATGSVWAKNTWGTYWTTDIKLNMAAVAMLIYLAYFILRGSFTDESKRAKIGAVYNIFAFASLIPLLFVIPRLTDSLHPGNGGNPGLGGEDLDNTMRTIFYPAIIGWTLIGLWMATLLYRADIIKNKLLEID